MLWWPLCILVLLFLLNWIVSWKFVLEWKFVTSSHSYYNLLILTSFCSKVPAWLRKFAPPHALDMQEEAWSAYPRCKSGLPCPLDIPPCVFLVLVLMSFWFFICKWMPHYPVLKVKILSFQSKFTSTNILGKMFYFTVLGIHWFCFCAVCTLYQVSVNHWNCPQGWQWALGKCLFLGISLILCLNTKMCSFLFMLAVSISCI